MLTSITYQIYFYFGHESGVHGLWAINCQLPTSLIWCSTSMHSCTVHTYTFTLNAECQEGRLWCQS